MPKDAFSRLLDDDDDDLAPLTSLPSWEAHTASGWHYIENERGRAVVLIEGDRGCGMVRYADKVMVPIAWAPVKKLFEQVESILRDRPTGWDRLSTDILGDEAAPEAPKGVVPLWVYREGEIAEEWVFLGPWRDPWTHKWPTFSLRLGVSRSRESRPTEPVPVRVRVAG